MQTALIDSFALQSMPVYPDEDIVPVLVEVPFGTPNKYELEKDWGLLALDRVLHSSIFYPGDYGFVPNTLCGDGDPIDVLILSNYPLTPGVVADARIIGVMDMEDEKGEDQKLLAVVHKDPRSAMIRDLSDLPSHRMREIQHFFANYKRLESKPGHEKWAEIKGFGNKEKALEDLRQSRVLYREHKELEEVKKKVERVEEEHRPPADFHHAPRDLFGVTRAGAAPRYDMFPDVVQAYIECPKGANNKYEFDEHTGCVKLDRVLHSAVFYPYDYGFIPRTLCGDGDPLDILVLSTFSLAPGTVADARVIGVLDMEDEKGADAKLLAVVHQDPRFLEVNDLADVADHVKTEIKHFFETYKSLEKNKWAKVTGWRDKKAAIQEVLDASATYDKENAKEFVNVPRLYHLDIGQKAPHVVNAIVENPKGSSNKYKFCKEVGLLKLDRVFHSSAFYPGNYGFIPQTLGSDGNPMDVLILSSFPLHFQCAVAVRAVAMLSLVDERGPDTKIIAVAVKEPRMNEIQDLDSLPAHVKEEINQFFQQFKDLEDSNCFSRITGWSGRDAAIEKIRTGHELFYLFGQRMDEAETKVFALEQENATIKVELSSLQERLEKLEKKVG